MSGNNDLIYVNCFYYGFYISKSQLSNYNIKPEQLVEDTNKIIKENKKVECENYGEENKYRTGRTEGTETSNINYYIYDLSKSIYNFSNIYNFHGIIKLFNCNKILAKLSKYEFNIIR